MPKDMENLEVGHTETRMGLLLMKCEGFVWILKGKRSVQEIQEALAAKGDAELAGAQRGGQIEVGLHSALHLNRNIPRAGGAFFNGPCRDRRNLRTANHVQCFN